MTSASGRINWIWLQIPRLWTSLQVVPILLLPVLEDYSLRSMLPASDCPDFTRYSSSEPYSKVWCLWTLFTLSFWHTWTSAMLSLQACRCTGYNTFALFWIGTIQNDEKLSYTGFWDASDNPEDNSGLSLTSQNSCMLWAKCKMCCTGFWLRTGSYSRLSSVVGATSEYIREFCIPVSSQPGWWSLHSVTHRSMLIPHFHPMTWTYLSFFHIRCHTGTIFLSGRYALEKGSSRKIFNSL